jgi:hypothetical protein
MRRATIDQLSFNLRAAGLRHLRHARPRMPAKKRPMLYPLE